MYPPETYKKNTKPSTILCFDPIHKPYHYIPDTHYIWTFILVETFAEMNHPWNLLSFPLILSYYFWTQSTLGWCGDFYRVVWPYGRSCSVRQEGCERGYVTHQTWYKHEFYWLNDEYKSLTSDIQVHLKFIIALCIIEVALALKKKLCTSVCAAVLNTFCAINFLRLIEFKNNVNKNIHFWRGHFL